MRFSGGRGGRMLKMLKLLPAMAFLVGVLIFAGATFAAPKGTHKHQDGLQLVGNKLGTNGKHELHKTAGHTVHAQVSNKKVAQITVTGPKGNVAVTKYRSSKKLALADTPNEFFIRVASNEIAQIATDYIGYAFTDGVDTYIYWFPADVILDPSGAIVYIAPI